MLPLVTDDIIETVRIELTRRRLTQAELARRIGYSQQTVSNHFRGETGVLSDFWAKVLDELGFELTLRPKGDA